MKLFTLFALVLFPFVALADDIVDLNVAATWTNNNFNARNTESYSFEQSWDLTTGVSTLLSFSESGSPSLALNFDFTTGDVFGGRGSASFLGVNYLNASGAGFLDQYGDMFQIIPGVYNGEIVNDPPFGTVGNYTQAEVDIFCNSDACKQVMQNGFLDGQATSYSMSITQGPLTNTPELSSGPTLAAGLLLSSAFILYRRRKANLDRAI